MPRRFSAPIPVYSTFGHPRNIGSYEVHKYIQNLWLQTPVGEDKDRLLSLVDQGTDVEDSIYFPLRRMLVAWGLASLVSDIVNMAEIIARWTGDVLEIDDRFLIYINPDLGSDLSQVTEAYSQVDSATKLEARRAGLEWFYTAFSEWVKEHQSLYPELNIEDAAYMTRELTPPCWHAGNGHEDIVRGRGRRFSPTRRAATWATYIISWIVGSQTVAVRLWNMLAETEYQWGNPNDPAEALAKYTDAKKRLVDDLRATGGQNIIPAKAVFLPSPPLDPSITPSLEAMSLGMLGKCDIGTAIARIWNAVWGEAHSGDRRINQSRRSLQGLLGPVPRVLATTTKLAPALVSPKR